MAVLAIGLAMGLSGVKPIPVILTVQALNGFILPLITFYLILLVNDPNIVPHKHRHSAYYNLVLIVLLGVMLLLGLNNIDRSISEFFHLTSQSHLEINFLITIFIMVVTAFC
ncbi:MAG: hypothetical protein HC811_08700 [Flammeovirgaceae bacterium]|nr:hypothetical protein [Flammeovirgaceae bacterium]